MFPAPTHWDTTVTIPSPRALPATHWKVAMVFPMALAATEAVPSTETVDSSRILPSWNMLLSRPLVTPKRRMFFTI